MTYLYVVIFDLQHQAIWAISIAWVANWPNKYPVHSDSKYSPIGGGVQPAIGYDQAIELVSYFAVVTSANRTTMITLARQDIDRPEEK
jgi:hypothetical protein